MEKGENISINNVAISLTLPKKLLIELEQESKLAGKLKLQEYIREILTNRKIK